MFRTTAVIIIMFFLTSCGSVPIESTISNKQVTPDEIGAESIVVLGIADSS